MTEGTLLPFDRPAVKRKKVTADLESGLISAGVLDGAATVLWNGPLGAFEVSAFAGATVAVARHAAALTRAGALASVAGGGDTVAALNAAGVADDFTYVSAVGGAFLEWLEGRTLPGIAALEAS